MTIKEDTQVKTEEQENEAILAEMIESATKAPEPGELARDPVVHRGSEDVPVPMVAKLESAGYSVLYDTRTAISSLVNNNMLRSALRKRRPDGSVVFTPFSPTDKRSPIYGMEVKRGTYKCLLHKENPNRELYDERGFPTCSKDNLASPFQVTRHMQKRHKLEYAEIEKERVDAEKEKDRKFQESVLKGVIKASGTSRKKK